MSGAAPENDTATEDERRAAIMARLDEARAEKARAAELAPDMSKYGTHKKITCDGCAIEVIASPRHCLSFCAPLRPLRVSLPETALIWLWVGWLSSCSLCYA